MNYVHISVIMMTLNKSKYLPLAVASVMEYEQVELVLVSPSEEDQARSYFKTFSELYGDRIRFVLQSDSSPSEGLNNGLMAASGEIIGVLNGDDFYLPGALKFVSETFIESPDVDLFLGGGLVADEEQNLVKFVIPGNISKAIKFKMHSGAFTFLHQSMFYKKSSFPHLRFNEANRTNWDTEFLLDILELSPNIFETQKILSVFRLSAGSITTNLKKEINKGGFHEYLSAKQIASQILRIWKFLNLMKWLFVNQLSRESYRMRK